MAIAQVLRIAFHALRRGRQSEHEAAGSISGRFLFTIFQEASPRMDTLPYIRELN